MNLHTLCPLRRGLLRAHERAVGRDTFKLLREIEQNEQLDKPSQEQLRTDSIKHLLTHSRDQIPYWCSRLKHLDLDRFEWGNLLEIPPLTRSEIVRNREAMHWSGPGKDLRHQSGGTTDDNLIFYWGRERQAWDRATRMRGLARLGIAQGDPVMHIWPRESSESRMERLRTSVRDLRDWIVADPVIDPRPWNDNNLEALGRKIDRFKPSAIIAYPSWLIRISRARRRIRGLFHHQPQLILTCGEILFETQRREIEDAFQTTVYQEYGSQDAGLIAHEDSTKTLRLNREPIHFEILRDGRPAKPATLGEIVITHFYTPRMPFIRYATGDVARAWDVEDEEARTDTKLLCPRPEGRTSDMLLSQNGEIVASRLLIDKILETTGIDLFSLQQTDVNRIDVLSTHNPPTCFTRVTEEILQSELGVTQVTFQCGNDFRTLRSGKHRFTCCPASAAIIGHDKRISTELSRSWPQMLETVGVERP